MQSSAAAAQVNRILPGISCFAWNKDCSKIAICPTNREIWVFKTNNTADISKWERVQILKEVRPNMLNGNAALEPCELIGLESSD